MSSASASIHSLALTKQQLFGALASDPRATVITPNRRLAAYLQDEFGIAQQLAGNVAWATPDILPLATFLERSYLALGLRDESKTQPQILSAPQSQLLWEQVVRTTDVSSHLLSLAQTARQAASAWSVAHAWELLPAMRTIALFEDAEIFLGWAQRFQQLCQDRNVVDGAVLATFLTASIRQAGMQEHELSAVLPRKLYTVGFDIVTPQLEHFLGACDTFGVAVHAVTVLQPDDSTHRQCRRLEFATEDAELSACASWTRQRLRANPFERIAIVVPDLRARRGAIARALTDALQPGQRAGALPAAPDAGAQFNISLGIALNEYALIHDALSLIEFSQNRAMSFLSVSALMRSPFMSGADRETVARAMLDAALRKALGPEINMLTLQRKLKLAADVDVIHAASKCPTLIALIDRVASMDVPAADATAARTPGAQVAGRPSPRDWSRHFGQVLRCWGFPGDVTLDSADYQVVEKFRDALAALSMLESVQPRMRADEALRQLRRIVADTVFQPKVDMPRDAGTPVQVLGVLESSGQSFDALWVTGLSEDAWPIAARPNPFIPASLQRATGVTEGSAAASLALDERITAGWRGSAAEVVFSHSHAGDGSSTGEQKRAASALTRDIPATEFPSLLGEPASTDYARALFPLGRREPIPDAPLQSLPPPTKVRGGAAVLRDQAACPFRAFARHRLGANRLATPVAGLDSATRGILLHRLLALVWNQLETHARLVTLHEHDVARLVQDAATKAIAEMRNGGVDSLSGRFADIEHARLSRLVTEWLSYERERGPFDVVACEQAHDVSLSGLSMRLRLDRLDRLTDGTHALIDYKSGGAHVASWLGQRPDEPQLPLYFLTSGQAISVLTFARAKRGQRGKVFGFEGVSAVPDLLPDVGPIEQKSGMEKKGYISWDVLIAEWEESINALAKHFVEGDALVDPKNGALTCSQCDLQSVCRISEVLGVPALDDDGAIEVADAGTGAIDE